MALQNEKTDFPFRLSLSALKQRQTNYSHFIQTQKNKKRKQDPSLKNHENRLRRSEQLSTDRMDGEMYVRANSSKAKHNDYTLSLKPTYYVFPLKQFKPVHELQSSLNQAEAIRNIFNPPKKNLTVNRLNLLKRHKKHISAKILKSKLLEAEREKCFLLKTFNSSVQNKEFQGIR